MKNYDNHKIDYKEYKTIGDIKIIMVNIKIGMINMNILMVAIKF